MQSSFSFLSLHKFILLERRKVKGERNKNEYLGRWLKKCQHKIVTKNSIPALYDTVFLHAYINILHYYFLHQISTTLSIHKFPLLRSLQHFLPIKFFYHTLNDISQILLTFLPAVQKTKIE